MPTLADRLVPGQLWQLVEPLLPSRPPHHHGGRPRQISDRACFAAVVFMGRTSTPWELLPARAAGLRQLLDRLPPVQRLDQGRGVRPAQPAVARPARRGRPDRLGPGQRRLGQPAGGEKGEHTGPNPTDRGKAGSKLHLAADGGGIPLAVVLTGANTNDSVMFEPLLDELPAVATSTGRRRCRPGKVHADKAYDHRPCRPYLHKRGIKPRIARRGIDSSDRLGRYRWKAERTIAWLLGCRRLRVRFDRCDERFYAFVLLASSLICYQTLHTPP